MSRNPYQSDTEQGNAPPMGFNTGGMPQPTFYNQGGGPGGQPAGSPPKFGDYAQQPGGAPGPMPFIPPMVGMNRPAPNLEQDSFLSRAPEGFTDIKIRHNFIKKVYSIVAFQLMITIAISTTIFMVDPVRKWFYANPWFLYMMIGVTFVIMMVLACCESVARKHPLNMILLLGFTVAESVLVGVISSTYKTDTVIIAAGITCIVVVGLTIFAFQTKIDFTGMGTYLFVMALVLMGFGIFAIIFRSTIMHVVYAALGAGLFSMYLVFDTQLMLGGKHKYSISPEDYIMAALSIYVDIINLFLMILRLVSAAKDN